MNFLKLRDHAIACDNGNENKTIKYEDIIIIVQQTGFTKGCLVNYQIFERPGLQKIYMDFTQTWNNIDGISYIRENDTYKYK